MHLVQRSLRMARIRPPLSATNYGFWELRPSRSAYHRCLESYRQKQAATGILVIISISQHPVEVIAGRLLDRGILAYLMAYRPAVCAMRLEMSLYALKLRYTCHGMPELRIVALSILMVPHLTEPHEHQMVASHPPIDGRGHNSELLSRFVIRLQSGFGDIRCQSHDNWL